MNKKKYWETFYDTAYEKSLGRYALARDRKIIKSLLLEVTVGKALDFPCGMGRHTELLQSLGHKVVAADINAKMLADVADRYKVRTILADILSFRGGDQKYDIVLSSRVCFHYDDLSFLLSNLSYALKNDGVLIFDTLNKYSIRHLINTLAYLIFRKKFVKEELYFRSRTDVEKILESCGYSVEKSISTYLFPTRAYKYLGNYLCQFLDWLEVFIPDELKVLTFWKVRRIQIHSSHQKPPYYSNCV